MRLSITVLFTFLLFGCSTAHKAIKEERKAWNFRTWEADFKARGFCLCLLEGYEDSSVRRYISETDPSFRNPLGIAIFDSALKPVIRQEVAAMKRDSLSAVTTMSEAIQGKQVFNHCLQFYQSKRLDSLAHQEKKRWQKIKNIQEEVQKYVPTW